MSEQLLQQIDQLIEASTEQLAADTIKLVNIKSVQESPLPGAPFGAGPRAVLDAFLEMSEKAGYYTTDYGVGVVSAAMKNGQPDLGIWIHGDVVPEGEGWNFPPYEATAYKGCIIGRGATDNKGQCAAVFNLFHIFKKLGIELKYNPAIYMGSNEETGMKDIQGLQDNPDAKGFLNVCTPPKMSLVPDGSFSVGYGGKGGLTLTLRSRTSLHGFTLVAGTNAAPGLATAVFDTLDIPDELPQCTVTKAEKTEITSFSPPRHGSNPDPNGNMITQICAALLDANLVAEEDKGLIRFFQTVSSDIYGKCLGIETTHEIMTPLTVFFKSISMVDGCPQITLNIRFPIGITADEIIARVGAAADKYGLDIVKTAQSTRPYINDVNDPVVGLLYKAASDVTDECKKPYLMSGGTYAHWLPNAWVFGMDGNLPPEDFPKGRGGAHGIDEAVSLFRLKRAMRIYARALLALNDVLG